MSGRSQLQGRQSLLLIDILHDQVHWQKCFKGFLRVQKGNNKLDLSETTWKGVFSLMSSKRRGSYNLVNKKLIDILLRLYLISQREARKNYNRLILIISSSLLKSLQRVGVGLRKENNDHLEEIIGDILSSNQFVNHKLGSFLMEIFLGAYLKPLVEAD